MSSFATVARKSLNDKFTAKIDFPIGHFMLPLLEREKRLDEKKKNVAVTDSDIGSLKSLHTFFDSYKDHIGPTAEI